jgi:hypothetical protein
MLPIERLRFDFDRERDFEDLIWSLIQPFEAAGRPCSLIRFPREASDRHDVLAIGEGDKFVSHRPAGLQ